MVAQNLILNLLILEMMKIMSFLLGMTSCIEQFPRLHENYRSSTFYQLT